MAQCPHCYQQIKLTRVCFKCKKPISISHKWRQIVNDDFSFRLEHWDCKDPVSWGDKFKVSGRNKKQR